MNHKAPKYATGFITSINLVKRLGNQLSFWLRGPTEPHRFSVWNMWNSSSNYCGSISISQYSHCEPTMSTPKNTFVFPQTSPSDHGIFKAFVIFPACAHASIEDAHESHHDTWRDGIISSVRRWGPTTGTNILDILWSKSVLGLEVFSVSMKQQVLGLDQ